MKDAYKQQYHITQDVMDAFIDGKIPCRKMLSAVLHPMYHPLFAVHGKESVNGLWIPIGNGIYRLSRHLGKELSKSIKLDVPLWTETSLPWEDKSKPMSLYKWQRTWYNKTTESQRELRCKLKLRSTKELIEFLGE